MDRHGPGAAHPGRFPARAAAPDGYACRLRAGDLRGVHGPRRWECRAIVPDARCPGSGRRGDDDRGSRRTAAVRASGRVPPAPGAPVRVLHARFPRRRGGGHPVRREVQPRRTPRTAHRSCLPLHRLPADRRGGARVPRLTLDTAARLVSGQGQFVGDLHAEGHVEVCFVRSALPHARVDRVDLRTQQGVTGVELGLRPIPLEAGGMVPVTWQPLALDRVRYVGEPIAMVWAEDRYTAEDLAERAVVDCSPLSATTPIHDSAPDDVLLSRVLDSGGLDDAMRKADVVIERTFRPARQSAVPLETRGVLAEHDATTGVTTIWTSTQLPHLVRRGIAHALGAAEASVRVRVPNVGGGFGVKANLYAEEIAVAAIARRLGVPVRWIEDRTENLLAATHAHDTRITLRVAADGSGRLLAVDAAIRADVGAYSVWPTTAMPEAAVAAMSLFAPYVYPRFRVRIDAVATNKAPVGPCRGIGQNAAVFATERTMDLIAAQLRIDPVEVRRRIVVRDLPWTSPAGRKLDSGDYEELFSLLEPEYLRLRAVQAEARAAGRLFGVGLGVFSEMS